MGVTLGRKVLKGGEIVGGTESHNLGPALTDKVDTFLGLCGGNWGLTTCYTFSEIFPTCNDQNGYFPGSVDASDMSAYLKDLNDDNVKEAENVFSLFSTADMLLAGNIVWGRYTSEFPTQDGFIMKTASEYTHIHMRDYTKEQQFDLVTKHTTDELQHGHSAPWSKAVAKIHETKGAIAEAGASIKNALDSIWGTHE